jgi:hypothetical protein
VAFSDDALASEFLSNWPHYRINYQIEKLERQRNQIAVRLQQRIDRNGFDLSKIQAEHRWAVASRFCEMSSKIHDLDWQLRYLKEAVRLSKEWAKTLGSVK